MNLATGVHGITLINGFKIQGILCLYLMLWFFGQGCCCWNCYCPRGRRDGLCSVREIPIFTRNHWEVHSYIHSELLWYLLILHSTGEPFDIGSQRIAASNGYLKDSFVEALKENFAVWDGWGDNIVSCGKIFYQIDVLCDFYLKENKGSTSGMYTTLAITTYIHSFISKG